MDDLKMALTACMEEYDRERDAEKKEAIVQRLKEQLNRI